MKNLRPKICPIHTCWVTMLNNRINIYVSQGYDMPDKDSKKVQIHDYKPKQGDSHAEVLNGLQKLRKELPSKYFYDERGSHLFERICTLEEYYIPELMFAAHITNSAIDLLKPHLKSELKTAGVVLLGTVSGDMHDIGKNIVGTILKVSGIKVHDLGVDVPVELWIQKIKELNPDIVGLSCLMAASISNMRNTIQEIEKQNLRDQVKIVVGGGALSKSTADQIGADAYAYDAMDALKIVKELMD